MSKKNNNDNIKNYWKIPEAVYLKLMDFLAKNCPPAQIAGFCNMVNGQFYILGAEKIDNNTEREHKDNSEPKK